MLAVFGYPKSHEDDPIRAIKAAREIHAAVESKNPDIAKKLGREISMHTGINTGFVITGEVDVKKAASESPGTRLTSPHILKASPNPVRYW